MKANRQKDLRIKHVYSVLCETLIAGKDDRFSLINTFNNVRLNTIPGALMGFGIVTGFLAPPGSRFGIAVEDPDVRLYSRVLIRLSKTTICISGFPISLGRLSLSFFLARWCSIPRAYIISH